MFLSHDAALSTPLWDPEAVEIERRYLAERRSAVTAELRSWASVLADDDNPQRRARALQSIRLLGPVLDHLDALLRELDGREHRH